MRVTSITLDGEELPAEVAVTMTIAEAAAITRVFGAMNGYAQQRLGVDSSIYDALTGGLINRFWDAGIDDLLPKHPLATLNETPDDEHDDRPRPRA